MTTQKEKNGRLMRAVERGFINDVRTALAEGAEIDHRRGGLAGTPLMQAVVSRHTAIIALLIECGANVNVADSRGATALHFAAIGGQGYIVSMLLDADANADAATDEKETPLHFSARNAHNSLDAAVVLLLLSAGADPLRKNTRGERASDLMSPGAARDVVERIERGRENLHRKLDLARKSIKKKF